MLSSLRFAICLSAIVGVVWAGPFENVARASNSSDASNSTTATTPTLRPSSSIPLPSSNSTIATSTATPSVSNSSPVLAMPLSSDDGDNEAKLAEFAKQCHRTDKQDDTKDGNYVFCQPIHLQNVTVSKSYPFVWDSRAFEPNATNTISLNYIEDPSDTPLISATNISNSKGYALLEIAEKWLRDGKSNNLKVYLTSTYEGSNETSSGPTIVLIPKDDPSPSKKPSKVGLGVGIPFAFGAVAVIALGAFCCLRKRRRAAKGYLASKSRSGHRAGAVQVEDDDFIGGTRGPGRFRDEPSSGGGLELQDRSRRHAREDSLGSLTSTPTEDFGGLDDEGRGRRDNHNNAFRDEISRQRTLRG